MENISIDNSSGGLEIVGLSASYDGRRVLDDITLSIPGNRITAVIGPSGCGKTTLLRAVNGLIKEEPGVSISGSVRLNGEDTSSMPPDELRRRIGLVFQMPAPFPFSILRNMTYAPQFHGVRGSRRLREIAEEKLRMAGLWDEVKDDLGRSAVKLSGGQQQRLCIARALTAEPDVLMLDEPCSALDVKSSSVIEHMLTELKKRYTIVIVTHNIAQARRISDFTAFIYSGALVEFGETAEFFSAPKERETRDFLSGETAAQVPISEFAESR